MKAFEEIRGQVMALNEDTGNADREPEQRAFMVNFDGIVGGKHTSQTREADADDARAYGIEKGETIRNLR